MNNRELIFEILELDSIGKIDLNELNYYRNTDCEEIEFESQKYKITCVDEVIEHYDYNVSRDRTLIFKIEHNDELVCYFGKKMYEQYDRCEEYYEIIDYECTEMKQKEIVTKVWEKVGRCI